MFSSFTVDLLFKHRQVFLFAMLLLYFSHSFYHKAFTISMYSCFEENEYIMRMCLGYERICSEFIMPTMLAEEKPYPCLNNIV